MSYLLMERKMRIERRRLRMKVLQDALSNQRLTLASWQQMMRILREDYTVAILKFQFPIVS